VILRGFKETGAITVKYATTRKLEIQEGKRYIASRSSKGFIRAPQDILDLLVWGNENGTNLFLLEIQISLSSSTI